MKNWILALTAIAATIPAWSADAPAAGATASPTPEQMAEEFLTDLQAKRADIMAKGLTLTAEQASKFWPMFEAFEKEQRAIVDGQVEATKAYADNFATLTDAQALAYVESLMTRDARMNALRVSWLAKFQKVVPPKIAARAIQLDRRLGQVSQVGLSSRIPLIR